MRRNSKCRGEEIKALLFLEVGGSRERIAEATRASATTFGFVFEAEGYILDPVGVVRWVDDDGDVEMICEGFEGIEAT